MPDVILPDLGLPLQMQFLSGSDILRKNQNLEIDDVLEGRSNCESVEEAEISDSDLKVIESRIQRHDQDLEAQKTKLEHEAQKFHIQEVEEEFEEGSSVKKQTP